MHSGLFLCTANSCLGFSVIRHFGSERSSLFGYFDFGGIQLSPYSVCVLLGSDLVNRSAIIICNYNIVFITNWCIVRLQSSLCILFGRLKAINISPSIHRPCHHRTPSVALVRLPPHSLHNHHTQPYDLPTQPYDLAHYTVWLTSHHCTNINIVWLAC